MVTYSSLEGVSLCGNVPMQFVLSSFDGRARSERVLAAITMVGGGAVDEAARASARCELSFSFVQWLSLPYVGWVSNFCSQVAGAEALSVGSELIPFPVSVCSALSQQWHLHPRVE